MEANSKRAEATAAAVRRALRRDSDASRAAAVARFFKCGPGEYGEGDVFIGVTVPAQRALARRFRDLPLDEVDSLLTSRIHEQRLTALLILVDQFRRASGARDDLVDVPPDARRLRKKMFTLYMRRVRFINNWDLVDTSAAPMSAVAGRQAAHLLDRLARSKHLWSRRIASCPPSLHRAGEPRCHPHRHDSSPRSARSDYKAVGWMLREQASARAGSLDEF